MDERSLTLAQGLVTPRYIEAGVESLRANERVVRSILAQRRCPDRGLSDSAIEQLLHQFALMDTNNFPSHCGAGEREGRVAAALVARRHYGLSHGIGRSGDVTSNQPKAAGSSLMYQLTNHMMLDLLRHAGAPSLESAVVIPMATGMTLALVLRSVTQQRVESMRKQKHEEEQQGSHSRQEADVSMQAERTTPLPPYESPKADFVEARYVIWSRIDQKTALKCVEAAGLVPIAVSLRPAPPPRAPRGNKQHPTAVSSESLPETPAQFLQVHVEDIAFTIAAIGVHRVACVLSTTSCFAPRLPDDVVAIAQLCKSLQVPYVVNNAYGVQSRPIMRRLDAAIRLGRVDAVVQSGDKNFLVPVGGAVLSGMRDVVSRAAALYAGRASATPSLDLFITALHLGRAGFAASWDARGKRREELLHALRRFAEARGEDVWSDARNDISLAVTMRRVNGAAGIGARLFRDAVTGPRVVLPSENVTQLCGLSFRNYGMHSSEFAPCPMLVIACGIGMTEEDVCGLMERLESIWPIEAKTS